MPNKIINHGCWCAKVSGSNPDFAGEPVDDIDKLCKEWSSKRRCNGLIGGSCPTDVPQATDYFIERFSTGGVNLGSAYSCDTTVNLNDDCLLDSCYIDAYYAAAIYDYLAMNPGWSEELKTSGECSKLTGGAGSDPFGGSSIPGGHGYMCVGNAPDVSIERL